MRKEKLPAKRIRVLVVIMALWGVGIAARLYFLQVVRSAHYIEKAAEQQQDLVTITPRRGDILDTDGNVLAISVPSNSIFARPKEIKDRAAVAKFLSRVTKLPVSEIQRKLDPSRTWVFIKRKISEDERKAIERANLPGIGLQPEFRRFYPQREMAAHLLGFVNVDEEGQSGLEGKYNSVVRGEPGKALWFVDARRTSYQREQQTPQVGATITTTIDKNIQSVIERELRAAAAKTHAAGISIVVTDPSSGAILGMAGYPTFNPNDYRDYPKSSWSQNPAVDAVYEPGSTFKMVTIAAALEEGLTTPDEMIYCGDGAIVVNGRTIHDHERYGMLSVSQIMQNSSNVGTIKLALRVGPEKLSNYIARYGFGRKTKVDLPTEASGIVHPLAQWTDYSLPSIAIGHELSVTPLQSAMMVSAVANGGVLYKPYVVKKIEDPRGGITEIKPSGTRIMSETTAHHLRNMLEDVVTDGTAKKSQLEGYRAGGKTGTAQKPDPDHGGYYNGKYVSSFAGFAPVSNPKLSIVVVVDDPKGQYYGGEVAAPVFKRIAELVLRMKSVLPDVPHYAPHYTATPERKEKPAPSPVPGTRKPDIRVMDTSLTSAQRESSLEFGEILVPDFMGQSMRHAVAESTKLGLDVTSDGSGQVVWQSLPAGAQVRPGTRIRFKFSLK